MAGDEFARLLYLILLLLFVGGWLFTAGRAGRSRALNQAMTWGVIFAVAIAAAGLWGDIRSDFRPRQMAFDAGQRVEVPRAADGHYYLTLEVDGVPIDFVVDTGASEIVLNRDAARRIGIDPDRLLYTGRAGTANGEVRTARIRVDTVELGPIVDRNVPVWVNEGRMDTSLLGMTYLHRFDSLRIEDGRLILER